MPIIDTVALPWSDSVKGNFSCYGANSRVILGENGSFVVGMIHFKKDADFIIRACNSHYQLLEAAKDAKHLIDVMFSTGRVSKETPIGETLSKLEKAIVMAEGS